MSRISSPCLSFAIFCISIMLGSCSGDISHHGYQLDDKKLSYIQIGKTTQNQTLKIMGSPTAYGPIGQDIWYYIGKKTEHIAFLESDAIDDFVIKLTFDKNQIVENIEQKKFPKDFQLKSISEKTPTSGNEPSLIDQLIGNIGRFKN